MIDISTAIMAWVTDQLRGLPAGDAGTEGLDSVDLTDFTAITHNDLEDLLVPRYIGVLPEVDGWDNPYSFWLDTQDPFGPELFAVASSGADGLFSGPVYQEGGFPFYRMNEDIVVVEGVLVRFPRIDVVFADGFECGDASAWNAIVP